MSTATPPDTSEPADQATTPGVSERIVVLTPEGMGVSEQSPEDRNPADQVEQPAKVMRIGSMIKQLLEEVRNAPLDDAGRTRLAEIHAQSIAELKDGLAPELIAELDRLVLPFTSDVPSDAELRIAQAQLVGWLEGLFHGIQAALVAQQMAAQSQLQQIRRQLPPGHDDGRASMPPGLPGHDGLPPNVPHGPRPAVGPTEGTGQYL